MRFLVAEPGPAFSVQDVADGWAEALQGLGHHVVRNNLGHRLTFYGSVLLQAGENEFRRALTDDQAVELAVNGLYAAMMRVRPHVLLAISAFYLPAELFEIARAAGIRVVVVHTESPYEDIRQLNVAPHADLNLINDPTNIDKFRAAAPTFYVPHAYRASIHHPGSAEPELVCDLGFVGTGFPSRVEFFEAMNLDGLDVLLGGNWALLTEDSPLRPFVGHDLAECMDNSETAKVYRAARCGINFYRREANPGGDTADGWACGPREVEMAACGLFFLRDPRPESDELFPMLPTFAGPEDASEQLRWWLGRGGERHEMAAKAQAAIADRTFDNHARQLLRLLGD